MKMKIMFALFIAALCTSKVLAYYGQYQYGGCSNYQSPSIQYPTCTYGATPTYSITYPGTNISPERTFYGGNGVNGWASTYPSNGGYSPSYTYYTGF